MIILSGQSQLSLAQNIAKSLQVPIAETEFSSFPNGEQIVRIVTPIEDQNVVIVQSTAEPTDRYLIELLLLIDAADRAGARKISIVLPWMGYSLQDKVFLSGQPLSAKVVANLISSQRVNRVFLLDLHNTSIVGFFSVPTRMISAQPIFERYVHQHFDPNQVVVVSPDFGGLKRARNFSEALGVPLATIEKTRDLHSGQVKMHSVGGADLRNKVCLLYDDVISTGGTVLAASVFLKEAGAGQVHMLATHGLFAGDARQRIAAEPALDQVVVTDSISSAAHSKITFLSTAEIIAAELNTLYHPHTT